MKLSKTAWNNVIIFSVMIIILFINTSNDRLFPDNKNTNDALLLPEHSVVLTLSITLPDDREVVFKRIGRAWQMTTHGVLLDLTNQQIEQLMFTWQQSSGLVQAAEVVIDGQEGVEIKVSLAGVEQELKYTTYTLADQLLVYNHQKEVWLALPAAMNYQLIPIS